MSDEPGVFLPDSVTYLRIPAPDPAALAAFYQAVLEWKVDPESGRFTDRSGHVIGHFDDQIEVAGERGTRPYVYVTDLDRTLACALTHRGVAETPAYAEGSLRVATFRDPAGNVIGLWQQT